jgi:hypothetical protein
MHTQTLDSSLLFFVHRQRDTVSIQEPLAYDDICFLQNALFKPGISHITFYDFDTSLLILNTCFAYCNKTVGYVSTLNVVSDSRYINLYHPLQHYYRTDTMEQFFFDYSYIDFLWIEYSPSLLESPWLSKFEKKSIDFNIQNTIPILVVSYKR